MDFLGTLFLALFFLDLTSYMAGSILIIVDGLREGRFLCFIGESIELLKVIELLELLELRLLLFFLVRPRPLDELLVVLLLVLELPELDDRDLNPAFMSIPAGFITIVNCGSFPRDGERF